MIRHDARLNMRLPESEQRAIRALADSLDSDMSGVLRACVRLALPHLQREADARRQFEPRTQARA
jgi:cell division protein ZapA (FtsZ GTPase activity inhibitor)